MKRILLPPFNEASAFFVWFINSLPGITGSSPRYLFAQVAMGECVSGARFGQNVKLGGARNIKIKKNVIFDRECELNACSGTLKIESDCKFNRNVSLNASVAGHISFGKNCIVGPGVIRRLSNHISSDLNIPIIYQGHESGCITIGNNVWIGAGAIILPNVKIGDGVIVGTGSVVTKSFPANQVIVGAPAKIIKERH